MYGFPLCLIKIEKFLMTSSLSPKPYMISVLAALAKYDSILVNRQNIPSILQEYRNKRTRTETTHGYVLRFHKYIQSIQSETSCIKTMDTGVLSSQRSICFCRTTLMRPQVNCATHGTAYCRGGISPSSRSTHTPCNQV